MTYHDEVISYKGRNLKKIEKLLKQKQQQIQSKKSKNS